LSTYLLIYNKFYYKRLVRTDISQLKAGTRKSRITRLKSYRSSNRYGVS